jgi:hypothetical protein
VDRCVIYLLDCWLLERMGWRPMAPWDIGAWRVTFVDTYTSGIWLLEKASSTRLKPFFITYRDVKY